MISKVKLLVVQQQTYSYKSQYELFTGTTYTKIYTF